MNEWISGLILLNQGGKITIEQVWIRSVASGARIASQLGFIMRSVIVDCDAGTDDALALMVLLAEEHRNPYKIVAVTCTYGNTTLDNVSRNVIIILEAMHRTDVR